MRRVLAANPVRTAFRGLALCAAASAALHTAQAQQPSDANAEDARTERGRYLVTAGDCRSCHGQDLSGGNPVESPIGYIHATNITPDRDTGIGTWTLSQFSAAMREGRSPDGHIFPAMPYTAYTGMSDDDIETMYDFLMRDTPPVSYTPPPNDLPLPFRRPAIGIWNTLFLDPGRAPGPDMSDRSAEVQRGRYLVEVLGHCSSCHTPRGQLMEMRADRHMAGGFVTGWWAPNITSHSEGLGEWSDAELRAYLTEGHTDRAVASGEMANVVANSLAKLSAEDMDAVIAYLRALPPLASSTQGPPSATAAPDGTLHETFARELSAGAEMLDGATLYDGACASCHGRDGRGSPDGMFPSLHRMDSLKAPSGANLVQVIVNGVDRQVGDGPHYVMPALHDEMSHDQIAALANYTSATFGGVDLELDAATVGDILDGRHGTPWLILHAPLLFWLGLGVGTALAVSVVLLWRRRRRSSETAVRPTGAAKRA